MPAALPIDTVLPNLLAALNTNTSAVLAAPPGAGKTTRVPLALLDAPWLGGQKIIMLEPRRIAARAAAARLAEELGEKPGQTVGYRIRGDSKPGMRIEVVTEGVLTRMLQSDPELTGIGAILFDEVHERSIHTDLGLALCLDVQTALRPDLRLVAMSATLDTARFADLMGAPIIESAGRLHPIETRWLDRPWRAPNARRGAFEAAAADLIRHAWAETGGDILAFLPGAGEIRRIAALIDDIPTTPLYGALPFRDQQRALSPGDSRRVILATSIAETSLTVPGVRVVVDAGRARRATTDPATGLSRLITTPVSRAEADQRRGRAGRLGPGHCFRMWTLGEEGGLPAQSPPEILEADLAPLALQLAVWGEADPANLRFPDPPPAGAYRTATRLLADLDALDADGRPTGHGRRLANLPTHPRLAHMLEMAGDDRPLAALIAALIGERDPMPGAGADFRLRLEGMVRASPQIPKAATDRIRAEAARLSGGGAQPQSIADAGRLAAMAWPDRIALRRPGGPARHLLSGGRGAKLDLSDPLAGERLLVALDLEDGQEARIRLALPITEADLRATHGDRIAWRNSAEWSARTRQVEAWQREMFGAIALAERHWRDADPDLINGAMLTGIRARGLDRLPWSPAATRLRARMTWARTAEPAFPDWTDQALTDRLEDWLAPHLTGQRRIEDLGALDLHQILIDSLDWEMRSRLDQIAPSHFTTPLGTRTPIDYGASEPEISLRVQELFGLDVHPSVAGGRIPLLVTLLSPAQRPVQTTRDLPGFWRSSYADVRKDMRAQYPRHPRPENPQEAAPTRRANPRKRG